MKLAMGSPGPAADTYQCHGGDSRDLCAVKLQGAL